MIDARTGDRVADGQHPGADEGSGNGPTGADAQLDAVFSQTHRASPGSVAVIRANVAAFATAAGLVQPIVERVKLAVSEAATNVVVHAYRGMSELGTIRVDAELAAGELRVSVTDTGAGLRPRPDSPGLGLGLGLIADLTDSFELLQGSDCGLCVLMRFAITAPAGS